MTTHLIKVPRDLGNLPGARKLADELAKDAPLNENGNESHRHAAEWVIFHVWTEAAYTSESSGASGFIPTGDVPLVERSLMESPRLHSAITRRNASNGQTANPAFDLLVECGLLSRVEGGYLLKLFNAANPELNAGYTDGSRVGRSKAAVRKVRLASEKRAQSDLDRVRHEAWRKPDGGQVDRASMFAALELIRTLDALLRRPAREPEALELETIRYALDVVGKYTQAALATVLQRIHFLRSQGKLPSSTELTLKNFDHLLVEIAPLGGWNTWAKHHRATT